MHRTPSHGPRPRVSPLTGGGSRTGPSRARLSAGVVTGLLAALGAWGCGPGPAPAAAPAIDAGTLGRQAEQVSALDGSYRILFDWTLNEPGMRLQGRGVARVEGPFRARLDLFTANGERVASAALVDDEMRVPQGMADFVPSAPLLWGTLGVFRPGPGAPAEATRADGERSFIRYRMAGGGEISYFLLDRRLDRMEVVSAGGVREELRLTRDRGERFPREAVYRHHGATRELRLALEAVEHVEAYPSDIWVPGR